MELDPAIGHIGGIPDGINDFRGEKKWTFSHNVQLLDKISGASFDLVNVYGPVQDYRKGDFLQELRTLVEECQNAIIIGGDFNLVRSRLEKSTGAVNERWMTSFNEFIAEVELREVHRAGARFTWSNNQELPIRVVLDRVLISGESESLFTLLGIQTIT